MSDDPVRDACKQIGGFDPGPIPQPPRAGDPPVPPANGVACHDCPGFGNYYPGVTECFNDDGEGADPDGRHVTSPVFITDKPLGRVDDHDNYVASRGLWAYDAEEADG